MDIFTYHPGCTYIVDVYVHNCHDDGFIIVTPRVRRATKASLDGTARFSV